MAVYVIQNQQRKNPTTGKLQPVFDTSHAENFGELVYLLTPTARPFTSEMTVPQGIIDEMKKKLKHFNDDDYLLLIGNPCFIGFAVAIASFYNHGLVKVLQWHGIKQQYIPITGKLF